MNPRGPGPSGRRSSSLRSGLHLSAGKAPSPNSRPSSAHCHSGLRDSGDLRQRAPPLRRVHGTLWTTSGIGLGTPRLGGSIAWPSSEPLSIEADTLRFSATPAPALEGLGRTGPVVVGELHEAEIDELRLAAPKLAGLLSNSHPAREVIRNLYRLGRLAERPAGEPTPRTEVDMAVQWWQTGDG